MNGILSQSQIPRARGTVSQVPADGFSLMLSQVGSIVQRDTTGTWLRTLPTRPISARPSLPHQIELILAKLTLRRMILTKRGGVATPVESGHPLSPTLPHPMYYVGAILSTIGGAASRCRKSFSRQRLKSRPPLRSIRRLADANGLVATLVVATYLGHPIRQMRPFPPTLYQRWRGHQRRLQPIPSWRAQMIGILVCPCHRLLLLR